MSIGRILIFKGKKKKRLRDRPKDFREHNRCGVYPQGVERAELPNGNLYRAGSLEREKIGIQYEALFREFVGCYAGIVGAIS